MSEIAMNAAHMIDMLPDPDKNLAYELIKKLVLAWVNIFLNFQLYQAVPKEDLHLYVQNVRKRLSACK